MKIRIAVCGAGSIGREFSLRYLCENPLVVVVAVVDLSRTAAKALAKDLYHRQAGAPVMGDKYRETVDPSFVPTADALKDTPEVYVHIFNSCSPLHESIR